MEFATLTQKLARIRADLYSLVEKINTAAGGEPFYVRITLENRHLTGLISNLRVNEYKLFFNFMEERLIGGEVVQKVSKKEIKLERLQGIDVFQTKSGKSMFIK